jgi:hypothetical protein
MKTHDVEVRHVVRVSVDETKFTPDFMREFRQNMYNFTSISDHVEHLAQLYARGLYDEHSFIEGYGPAEDFGIRFKIVDASEEVLGAP